ncbi:DUF1648 domain-containing protein, partial [Candidatus Micrarchaeota archaeon]|nr:DUF1648 domain-containing protein [Candidatus Micrarchaeota archaeon]
MNLEKSEIAVLIIVFISFITGWYFYPSFPEQMASHWNAQGNVDGYTAKLPGLFLFPLMMFACALLFIAVPRIDPLKANIFQFRKYYNGLIIILALFLFLIYIQTLLWNLGTEISPNITLPVGIGFLFFYTGILCDNAKRN